MKALILLCIVAVAVAMPTDIEGRFQEWRAANGRYYASKLEYAHRLAAFQANYHLVETFNAGNHSFTLSMDGPFADLTNAEYQATYLMPRLGGRSVAPAPATTYHPTHVGAAPDSWDWRTKNAVNNVKNQGSCGSCYTFGANDAMEHAYWKATNQLMNFAEQQLVDCSKSEGNEGCNGGWQDWCMNYAIKNGMMQTKDYSYTGRDGTCKFDASKAIKNIHNKDQVPTNEVQMKEAAYDNVIAIAIDASHFSFQLYSNGVYDEPQCKNGDDDLDHAVGIVGYGNDSSSKKDYWIVRNSWGTSWGQKGYIWMVRNKNNECGVATHSWVAIA